MAEAARVIKLVGGGADALRQAIESGVMSVEARHMAERVLAENGALRRRNAALELENRDLKLLNARYRDLEMRTIDQAVRAQDAGTARRDWRRTIYVSVFSAGALAAMMLTVVALLGCCCDASFATAAGAPGT